MLFPFNRESISLSKPLSLKNTNNKLQIIRASKFNLHSKHNESLLCFSLVYITQSSQSREFI